MAETEALWVKYRLRELDWQRMHEMVNEYQREYPDAGWNMLDAEDLRLNAPELLELWKWQRFCDDCDRASCGLVSKSPRLEVNERGRVRVRYTTGRCSRRARGGQTRDEDMPF